MIPEEAVEAAAKAIRDSVHPTQAAIIGPYMASEMQARAALEAALPFLTEPTRHQSSTDWPDIPRSRK